jgi:hypothetical protein
VALLCAFAAYATVLVFLQAAEDAALARPDSQLPLMLIASIVLGGLAYVFGHTAVTGTDLLGATTVRDAYSAAVWEAAWKGTPADLPTISAKPRPGPGATDGSAYHAILTLRESIATAEVRLSDIERLSHGLDSPEMIVPGATPAQRSFVSSLLARQIDYLDTSLAELRAHIGRYAAGAS